MEQEPKERMILALPWVVITPDPDPKLRAEGRMMPVAAFRYEYYANEFIKLWQSQHMTKLQIVPVNTEATPPLPNKRKPA